MFILICYDISDNRRRYRVERAIANFGVRVQKSVFEANLDEPRFEELRTRVVKLIDQVTDSVRYYVLCRNCINAVETDGTGVPPDPETEVTVVV
jgi:CRISPR-associated protein Cas2